MAHSDVPGDFLSLPANETVEAAQALYGVTTEKLGVSRQWVKVDPSPERAEAAARLPSRPRLFGTFVRGARRRFLPAGLMFIAG